MYTSSRNPWHYAGATPGAYYTKEAIKPSFSKLPLKFNGNWPDLWLISSVNCAVYVVWWAGTGARFAPSMCVYTQCLASVSPAIIPPGNQVISSTRHQSLTSAGSRGDCFTVPSMVAIGVSVGYILTPGIPLPAVDSGAPVRSIEKMISQGSILTFKANCPVGQVRLKIYLSCMKWHLSMQLYMLLSSYYWPVLSDKCHYNTTCPRSNFSNFLPVRDGRTKLKVEPCK